MPPTTTAPSPPSLDAALSKFADALGADAVLTAPHELREHRDRFQFATWDDNAASAVLLHETVAEVLVSERFDVVGVVGSGAGGGVIAGELAPRGRRSGSATSTRTPTRSTRSPPTAPSGATTPTAAT